MDSCLIFQPVRAVSFLLQPVSVCPFCTTEVASIALCLFFSLSIPHSRQRWVSLKPKLISWGVGASYTHSYIYMFLDIYNCRVRLGIKSDFRCEVLKYAKPCAEKYPHQPPPRTLFRTPRNNQSDQKGSLPSAIMTGWRNPNNESSSTLELVFNARTKLGDYLSPSFVRALNKSQG